MARIQQAALLLAMAFCCVAAEQPWVVRVEPSALAQAEAAYRAAGYNVMSVNTEHSFIKLGMPGPAPMSAPIASAALDGLPAWARPAAASLSPGEMGDQTIFPNGPEAAARAAAALNPSGDPATIAPTFARPAWAAQGAAPLASSVEAASVIAALSAVPGVQSVQPVVQAFVSTREERLAARAAAAAAAGLAPEATAAAAEAEPAAATCPSSSDSPLGPDAQTGRGSEGVPYGVKMVQGVEPEVIEIAKANAGKVMFCVIDTGLDRANWEFNKATTSGCMPNTRRPTGTVSKCKFAWYDDNMGHGTHTSGTIGAARNGRGIVGVSAEGAQIYHINTFGPFQTFDFTDIVDAWDDCLAELDARKAATRQPDMKAIISMSLGSGGDMDVVREAVKKLGARTDVLFLGAAGNGGDSFLAYPAGYPEVVSVAAVDWKQAKAVFSQYNPDVEWAAPGVLTLSTIPTAGAAGSSFNMNPSISVAPAAASEDIFGSPTPVIMPGSKTDALVSGKLVDCGLGTSRCAGAAGRICLLQRGEITFCQKVANCVAGGGIGAIIYEKADAADGCAALTGATLNGEGCPAAPAGGWPVVMTGALKQGKALQAKLRANPNLTVTLNTKIDANLPPLEVMSGTSMATPTAAGVAGVVWSAHSSCSAAELRAAISATALDKGTPGRDASFGYGIVQAAAAHRYLLAHPCSGKAPAAGAPEAPSAEAPTPAPRQPRAEERQEEVSEPQPPRRRRRRGSRRAADGVDA